jgi:hypothetical protein
MGMLMSIGVQQAVAQADITILTHGSNAVNQAWDQDLADFISSVSAIPVNVTIVPAPTSTTPTLETQDLVIIGRGSNSGDFNSDANRAKYNDLSVPLICESSFIVRNNRLRWFNSATIPDAGETTFSTVRPVPLHKGRAVWNGIDNSGDTVKLIRTPLPEPVYFRRPVQYVTTDTRVFTNGLVIRPIQDDVDDNNGLVIATHDTSTSPAGHPILVTWNTGQQFYDTSSETAGGPRAYFQIRDDDNLTSYVRATVDIPTNTMDFLTYQGRALYRNLMNLYVPGITGEAQIVILTNNAAWDQDLADFISSESNIPVNVSLVDTPDNFDTAGSLTEDELNAADLVIIARGGNSGRYQQANEVAFFNGLTAPILLESSWMARNNRLKWINSSTMGLIETGDGETSFTTVHVVDASSDAWTGIDTSGDEVKIIEDGPFDPPVYFRRSTQYRTTDTRQFTDRLVLRPIRHDMSGNNGHLIATHSGDNQATTPSLYPLLVTWNKGDVFYAGSTETAGGPRILFQIRDDDNLATPTRLGNVVYPTLDLLNTDGINLYKNVLHLLVPGVPVEMSDFNVD